MNENNLGDLKEEVKPTITLTEGRSVYVYPDDMDVDFIDKSNLPHFDVEDQRNWRGYKTVDGNPNLIGQVHHVTDIGSADLKPVFHLCYNPRGKWLNKEDLLAIIKSMDYLENFRKSKLAK